MWEQNETGLDREFSEDFRPTILRGLRWLGDDPELAPGVVNEGHGVPRGGADGPAASEEINLVVGIDAPSEVQRQMEVQQGGVGTRREGDAFFFLGLGASFVRRQARGAANGAILAGQLAGQQFLRGGVSGDFFIGQERDEAVLKSAKAAFDFAFGLRGWGDQMRNAQGRQSALKLRAGVPSIRRGFMAEQGQAVGVKSQGEAVESKGAAKVLEVVPGRVGWHKDGRQELARVVVHGEQEGLLIVGGPPLVDGGVVRPKLPEPGSFPAAAGLGRAQGSADEERKVLAGVGGHGFAVALEGKAGGEFVGDELIIGRTLERQKVFQELLHLSGPGGAMAAAGKVEGEVGWLLQPDGPQTKEVGPADIQELGGRDRVKVAAVEGVESLVKEG